MTTVLVTCPMLIFQSLLRGIKGQLWSYAVWRWEKTLLKSASLWGWFLQDLFLCSILVTVWLPLTQFFNSLVRRLSLCSYSSPFHMLCNGLYVSDQGRRHIEGERKPFCSIWLKPRSSWEFGSLRFSDTYLGCFFWNSSSHIDWPIQGFPKSSFSTSGG